MTADQKRRLCDDKFYALLSRKEMRCHCPRDADEDDYEYDERISSPYDSLCTENSNKRCGKFQADIDYYGAYME